MFHLQGLFQDSFQWLTLYTKFGIILENTRLVKKVLERSLDTKKLWKQNIKKKPVNIDIYFTH